MGGVEECAGRGKLCGGRNVGRVEVCGRDGGLGER